MTEKLRSLDPNPLGESDFHYDSFDEHMEKLEQQEQEENVEENPNKLKYLADLAECEEKLDKLQEKYADSLDEANKYVNVITNLLNDNRATNESIEFELNKLKGAISDIENNSVNLLNQNEELGEYLKLDDDFLTPEEHAIKSEKYFNNIKNGTDFVNFVNETEDFIRRDVKTRLQRY